MRVELITNSDATLNFSGTGKTREEFDELTWLEQLVFLETYTDIYNVEVQDWIILDEE